MQIHVLGITNNAIDKLNDCMPVLLITNDLKINNYLHFVISNSLILFYYYHFY